MITAEDIILTIFLVISEDTVKEGNAFWKTYGNVELPLNYIQHSMMGKAAGSHTLEL